MKFKIGDKREQIYQQIDKERETQDSLWPDRSQYTRSAPHILLLEEKLAKLRSLWYKSEQDALREEFLKIAAMAVRALEEIRA